MENSHLAWAIQELNNQKYEIISLTPEIIQKNPWSTVYRFKTNRGFIFLKKVPPALSIEPKIIDVLYKKFHAPVPFMIAANEKESCFLMKDAGIPLHQAFKENFKEDVFIQMMKDYITLQINAANKIELFLELGVPDWRLGKFPKLYNELIAEEKLLLNDRLNKSDLIILKNKSSKLIDICEQLSSYKIKDTFGHADFHDKNILIDPHSLRTTIIDLGEVVITHPFFSLHNCLHMAKENFSLSIEQYERLKRECYKPWLEFETEEHLFEMLNLIQQCWSIHAVLGEYRLLNSIDSSDYLTLSKQGRLAIKLHHWVSQ